MVCKPSRPIIDTTSKMHWAEVVCLYRDTLLSMSCVRIFSMFYINQLNVTFTAQSHTDDARAWVSIGQLSVEYLWNAQDQNLYLYKRVESAARSCAFITYFSVLTVGLCMTYLHIEMLQDTQKTRWTRARSASHTHISHARHSLHFCWGRTNLPAWQRCGKT